MPNNKKGLGTFSNDGLGMPIEISEKAHNKMREIVNEDKKKIEADFLKQLHRLDEYIKKNIGAIPREEEFIIWFFDKKKIWQWGKRLPKITDSEMLDFAKQYVNELNISTKKINNKSVVEASLILDMNRLKRLSKLLSGRFISEVQGEEFVSLFSDKKPLKKINWLLNGTLLLYFLNRLQTERVINSIPKENEFICNNFSVNSKEFRNIKQAKNNLKNNKHEKPLKSGLIDGIIDISKTTLPKTKLG